MSFAAPDLTGFFDAMQQFRSDVGSPVTWLVPTTPTWPGGTQINPDTGTPYDAMVKQSNAVYAEVVKTCLLIVKQASPLRPQSDVRFEPGGLFESMDIIVDIFAADWADVSGASDFTVGGQTYTVEEAKPFQLGGTIWRYLVYGAEH